MAEQEYADFSDMGQENLPDEIEENKSDEHMPIGYEENVNMEETPKEEIEEVKPQEETSKVDPKNDPSQNPYWQSKYDKEVLATKQEAERLRQELEQLKSQVNPPKKEEPLVRPQKPNTDDPLDLLKYSQELAEYQEKMTEQKFKNIDAYFQQMESERQTRIQQEEIARQRAWQVTQLTQAGLSPEEANQALVEFSKAAETPDQYFKDLAEFYKFKKGYKPSKVEQRATRNSLPPLGAIPTESEPQKVDPNDAFFSDMQGFIKKNY